MDERSLKEISEWVESIKEDVVDVGKQLKHLPSLEIETIQNHLQVKSISELTVVASQLSTYQKFIQTAILEDYLKEQNLVVTDKVQFYSDEGSQRGPFEYVDLEVDVGKTIKAVGYGHLFVVNTKTRKRFVLQVDEFGYERYKIRVFALNANQDDALKIITGLADYAKTHNILKGKKLTPSFSHIHINSNHTWESVILAEETKAELKRNVDLLIKSIDIYKANDLTFKRGLILKGPPGTGKTLIGKVLCNTIKDATFLWVTPGDLDEARRIRLICELARELSPTILFLEDIDLYGSHRERENRGVLGELMNQLDGLVENEFVIVIATTNRSEEIEDALRNRPGRFDRVIDVPLPDHGCRRQMFELFLANLNVHVKDIDQLVQALATSTDNYTGAHVKELINSAIISAIEEDSIDKDKKVILKIKHFTDNIELVKSKKIEATGFGLDKDEKGGRGRRNTILDELDLDDE